MFEKAEAAFSAKMSVLTLPCSRVAVLLFAPPKPLKVSTVLPPLPVLPLKLLFAVDVRLYVSLRMSSRLTLRSDRTRSSASSKCSVNFDTTILSGSFLSRFIAFSISSPTISIKAVKYA